MKRILNIFKKEPNSYNEVIIEPQQLDALPLFIDIETGLHNMDTYYAGSSPSQRPVGELFFDNMTHQYMAWNGTAWVMLGDSGFGQVYQPIVQEVIDEEYGITVEKLKKIAIDIALKSDDSEIKELINKLMVHVKLKHNDDLKTKCPNNYDDTLIG
jgi:hypothetical protein